MLKTYLIQVFGFFLSLYNYEKLLILWNGVLKVDNSLKTVDNSGISVDNLAKTVDKERREN
jgi:hypothetical protein